MQVLENNPGLMARDFAEGRAFFERFQKADGRHACMCPGVRMRKRKMQLLPRQVDLLQLIGER